MLGANALLLSTNVSDDQAGRVPKMIDLGHGEAASFLILVSDGAQSLPLLPTCGAAVTLVVTPPGAERGIDIAAPPGLIAYPFDKGGPCGQVYVSALLAGSAQRAECPACFPAPVPGKSVASDTVKVPKHPPVGSPAYQRWLERH
jgi:hypothetical protein